MPDSVPILALGATVAWVSLVTVEFYERIYRDRIKENSRELRAHGDHKINVLAERMHKGTVETVNLSNINALKNAEKILMWRRKITLGILFLSSIFSIMASWTSETTISLPVASSGKTEILTVLVPLAAIAYILLLAAFVAGFWFLWKMLWFDEWIYRISQSRTQPSRSAPRRRSSARR